LEELSKARGPLVPVTPPLWEDEAPLFPLTSVPTLSVRDSDARQYVMSVLATADWTRIGLFLGEMVACATGG